MHRYDVAGFLSSSFVTLRHVSSLDRIGKKCSATGGTRDIGVVRYILVKREVRQFLRSL